MFHFKFVILFIFEITLHAASSAPKYALGSYDVKNVGHHKVIKANVESREVHSPCPVANSDSHNRSFNVVCGRKRTAPVIGTCHWRPNFGLGSGEAKFERKHPNQSSSLAQKENDSLTCDCQSLDNQSPMAPSCGLKIEGPKEKVIIFGTSATRLTVSAGRPVEFWIEYTLSKTQRDDSNSSDGHSFFITHWYNTIFAKGTWHLVYSHRDQERSEWKNVTSQKEVISTNLLIYRASLRIDAATVDESGVYTFEINYDQLATILAFSLNVRSDDTRLQSFVRKPHNEKIHSDPFEAVNSRFLQAHSRYEIVCGATIGDHDPVKTQELVLGIYREPCDKDHLGNIICEGEVKIMEELANDSFKRIDPANGREYSYKEHGRHMAIVYGVEAIEPAVYHCVFTNNTSLSPSVSEFSNPIRFIPIDIPNASEKRGIEIIVNTDFDNVTDHVYHGDRIVFECRYQNIDYRFQRWQFIGDHGHAQTILHSTSRYALEAIYNSSLPTLGISRLTLRNADRKRDSGKYICELIDLESGGKAISADKSILVVSPVPPMFQDGARENTIVNIEANETDTLTMKCLIRADASPQPIVSWWKDGQHLPEFTNAQEVNLKRVLEEDAGNYSCLIKNRAGTIQKQFLVNILSTKASYTLQATIIGIAVVLAVIVVVLTTALAWINLKCHLQRKRLRQLHEQLLSSTKDRLDPNVPINQQPENLPYDSQYEIRREQLVLGPALGEGQFGRVLEGHVFSEDKQRSMRVAVKMPKVGMDASQQRMLLSEFKIMAYVGDHVNVVRLVATVTHCMMIGELYVASEYCEHGCLRDYLIRSRTLFENELIIGSMDKNGYILSNEFIRRSKSQGVLPATSSRGEAIPASTIDSTTRLRTSDLLAFAFQIANGMDYLASKNVVHRDLALRNVLLTKEMIIKIADFGLAMDKLEVEKRSSTSERKRSNVPLPVKWMALESILSGEYSVQSDVWSFGVVLWELFTLGESPYPDKAPNTSLAEWLMLGNRLGPPKYAPEEIYHLMTRCWCQHPRERPTFVECRNQVGIELHLRSQETLEILSNLLNSYHAYVNVRASMVNEAESPSVPLLESPRSVLDHFFHDDAWKTVEVENPNYNRTKIYSPDAVENKTYSAGRVSMRPTWV